MQNFIQIGLGVSVLCMRDFAPIGTKWLGYFFFWGGGFSRKATEFAKLDHAVNAAAVRQWRRRLSACVKAGAGHFDDRF